VRIIAGEFRSRRILAPKGIDTRPTLEQRRESLFNILQGEITGARVLDLFAGSGALGLEALSRGAAFAVFCDTNRDAAQVVQANIQSLALEARTALLHMDWAAAASQLAAEPPFDLIFLDPPYGMDYAPLVQRVLQLGLLAPEGLMMVERDRKTSYPIPPGYQLLRTKEYRDVRIDFIAHTREENI
jgi:16S rRNA (guanine966-N2)-methyltransferase